MRTKLIHIITYASILVASSMQGAQAETTTEEKTFSVLNKGTLHLSSDLGTVAVEAGSDSEVVIEAIKKARNKESLDNITFSFEQKGDDIYVEGKTSQRRQTEIHYKIKVPSVFNLDIKTEAGEISVGNVSGDHTLDTSAGEISVGDVASGNVNARTSGGSISVGDIGGNIELKTSGGSIDAKNIQGTAILKTAGGSIELVSGGNDVTAKTAGGSIEIGPVKGNVEVKTAGGSIEIGKATGNVIAKTAGGSIEIEGGDGTINAKTAGGSITVGESGLDAELKTAGGSISIKQAKGGIIAKTSGGSIEAEVASSSNASPIVLESSGGKLKLSLPESIAASIDAKLEITKSFFSNYRIYSDFPLSISDDKEDIVSGNGDINGGGKSIKLRTVNGDIYITKN